MTPSGGGSGAGRSVAGGSRGAGTGGGSDRAGGSGGAGAGGGSDRAGGAAGAGTDEVAYRGVRWRRSSSGRMMWFNDGLRRWVLWSAGSDAPPVPEDWEGDGGEGPPGAGAAAPRVGAPSAGAPSGGAPSGDGAPGQRATERPGLLRYLPNDAMARRPGMRSPYRIVPLVVVALIIGVAVYQATRPPNKATRQDIAAAMALKGVCLEKSGGTAQYPDYSPIPVSCSSAKAVVKVVEVVVPGPHAACPIESLAMRVLDPAAAGEPVECLQNNLRP